MVSFSIALIANLVTTVYVALYADTPALPHVLDQQLVLLFVWGILVPTIWGVNARWLPIFAGLQGADSGALLSSVRLQRGGYRW